jgi:hypothetical protein
LKKGEIGDSSMSNGGMNSDQLNKMSNNPSANAKKRKGFFDDILKKADQAKGSVDQAKSSAEGTDNLVQAKDTADQLKTIIDDVKAVAEQVKDDV